MSPRCHDARFKLSGWTNAECFLQMNMILAVLAACLLGFTAAQPFAPGQPGVVPLGESPGNSANQSAAVAHVLLCQTFSSSLSPWLLLCYVQLQPGMLHHCSRQD